MVTMLRLVLVGGLLAGCDDACPRGSMLDSQEGLIVTKQEHPLGWGLAQCGACHVHTRLHRTQCTPGVDLASIRETVDSEGDSSCVNCHGTNGIQAITHEEITDNCTACHSGTPSGDQPEGHP